MPETSEDTRPVTVELERMFDLFPDLPREAILKQDILRQGIRFGEDALRIASGYKPKDYFIFSFDLVPLREMSEHEAFRAPEEIRMTGGPWSLRPTIVSTRVNPESPYRVELHEGGLWLWCEGTPIALLEFPPIPSYYGAELSSGLTISQIAPAIEWGYLIYLTVYRLCQYWGKTEECRFCDLNENYRQQREQGREYTAVKSIADVVEAMHYIDEHDEVSRAYTVTGGSITSSLQGMKEAEWYARYAEAIEERFAGRWIAKAVVQAFPKDEVELLRRAGYQIYHPNYEVWDPTLFDWICPGKARYVGREEWMNRIVDAAEVFGARNVIPNFVGGVEMAQPNGYSDVQRAVASTMEGLDYFMSRGIIPRFTTWCPEPTSDLGRQAGPPLEYFVRLLHGWRSTFEGVQPAGTSRVWTTRGRQRGVLRKRVHGCDSSGSPSADAHVIVASGRGCADRSVDIRIPLHRLLWWACGDRSGGGHERGPGECNVPSIRKHHRRFPFRHAGNDRIRLGGTDSIYRQPGCGPLRCDCVDRPSHVDIAVADDHRCHDARHPDQRRTAHHHFKQRQGAHGKKCVAAERRGGKERLCVSGDIDHREKYSRDQQDESEKRENYCP